MTVQPTPDGGLSGYEKKMDDLRSQASRKSIGNRSGANAFARANTMFNIKGEGSDAGELQIEVDRLKTTNMILNQKLKT